MNYELAKELIDYLEALKPEYKHEETVALIDFVIYNVEKMALNPYRKLVNTKTGFIGYPTQSYVNLSKYSLDHSEFAINGSTTLLEYVIKPADYKPDHVADLKFAILKLRQSDKDVVVKCTVTHRVEEEL